VIATDVALARQRRHLAHPGLVTGISTDSGKPCGRPWGPENERHPPGEISSYSAPLEEISFFNPPKWNEREKSPRLRQFRNPQRVSLSGDVVPALAGQPPAGSAAAVKHPHLDWSRGRRQIKMAIIEKPSIDVWTSESGAKVCLEMPPVYLSGSISPSAPRTQNLSRPDSLRTTTKRGAIDPRLTRLSRSHPAESNASAT
jgi:hypothetical protein